MHLACFMPWTVHMEEEETALSWKTLEDLLLWLAEAPTAAAWPAHACLAVEAVMTWQASITPVYSRKS